MSGKGHTTCLSFLAILMSRKLWVLPMSISTMALSFLVCPFNLSVHCWLMPIIATSDILGVLSPSKFGVTYWGFSSSPSNSFVYDSSSFPTSHAYNFFELYSMRHICLWSHFSLHHLHFPSFNIWASKILLLSCVGVAIDIYLYMWFVVHSFFIKPCQILTGMLIQVWFLLPFPYTLLFWRT